MNQATRKNLFYILTGLFIIVVTVLIFYSNGWRFDFETFHIDKLGALYIETFPRDVSMKIEKTNFEISPGILRSGTLIANLFPKTYLLEVQKPGYRTWLKNFDVAPSFVTRTYPITLIPDVPTTTPIAQHIDDFWVGKKYTAWRNKNSVLFINQTTALGNELTAWSLNGNFAITKDMHNTLFLITINEENIATNLNLMVRNLSGENLVDAAFNPTNENELIIATNQNIYSFNQNRFTLSRLVRESVRKLVTIGSEIFAIKKDNSLIPLTPESEHTAIFLNILAEKLEENPDFYFQFSNDNAKFAILNKSEPSHIEAYFLESDDTFKKRAGDFSILDLQLRDPDIRFAWHQSNAYLFVQQGDNLTFLDVDNVPPVNREPIAYDIKKFQYNSDTNQLYILQNDTILEVGMTLKES